MRPYRHPVRQPSNPRRLPVVVAAPDPPGDELLTAGTRAYQRMDARLEARVDLAKVEGHVIPCQKGCSACCYYALEVQLVDVWVLAAHLRAWPDDARAGVRRRLTAALSRAREVGVDLTGLAHSAEARYFEAAIACPFLVDGACSVYPVRPSACRTHVAADTDPALCAGSAGRLEAVTLLDQTPVTAALFDDLRALFAVRHGQRLFVGALATMNFLLALDAAWAAVEGPRPALRSWLARMAPLASEWFEDVRRLLRAAPAR